MLTWRKNNAETAEDTEEQQIISIGKPAIDTSTQGNKIYFYSDVSKDSILNLNKQIDDLSKQMKITQFNYNLSDPPPIEIHICSDGGDIFASLASVDKLMNNGVPIHTYCEGVVASAATLLSVCGNKRFITKNSCMLIHQVSSSLWGNYMEFKQEVQNLDLIMSIIENVYLKKSKFKLKELKELLKHDLYLDSIKCLKMGLVDTIIY